jgi:hypothetical protein
MTTQNQWVKGHVVTVSDFTVLVNHTLSFMIQGGNKTENNYIVK